MKQVQQRSHCLRWPVFVLVAGLLALTPCILPAQTAAPAAPGAAPPQAAAPPEQGATAALPSFEVVSIKPNKSGSMMMRIRFTSDGISVVGVPAHMLLREALNISDNQLVGEPGWMNSDRFDIEAKVAAEDVPKLKDLKPTERWAMLLPVFEDRFALKYHHETKDLTKYVLVVAKSGLKMKEATPGDTYANGLKTPSGAGGAGMIRVDPGEMIGQAIPLVDLVRFLSFQFHSPVIDQTGLTGKYDINLKWTPDETDGSMMRPPGSAPPDAANAAPPPAAGPSIFTALEEQLGLKLEAHKEPGDAIVIDHIEQPSPN
jgi:bla regulator protein blaR1